MLMYDFEIVYVVPGTEMGITDYLSRSPHTHEPPDKSLTVVFTFSFIEFMNEIKNKTMTRAVIDVEKTNSAKKSKIEKTQFRKLGKRVNCAC